MWIDEQKPTNVLVCRQVVKYMFKFGKKERRDFSKFTSGGGTNYLRKFLQNITIYVEERIRLDFFLLQMYIS